MNGLLTDLYELTMAAGYFEAGKTSQIATFEFTVRRLPANRNFVIAAGLPQAVDYLLNLQLHRRRNRLPARSSAVSPRAARFFDYLRAFRFTGDLFAVPEGTPLFAGEPVLCRPRAHHRSADPRNLSALGHHVSNPDRIESRALRRSRAGRPVVEFGTRRAHTPEAGVLGARAAYIGGCAGTSNTLGRIALTASPCSAPPRTPGSCRSPAK